MHKTRYFAAALAALVVSSASWAFHPEHAGGPEPRKSRVAEKAFFKQELSISWRNVPLNEARSQLGPTNDKAWANFFAKHGNEVKVYIDPRSGTPTNIQGAFPMIPGNGVGNRLTLGTLSQKLGRSVTRVDEVVVEQAVRAFVRENLDVLNLDESQLGPARVTQVTPTLWQLHFSQQVRGIPVRHGRLVATISHGNLILIGTETWGNVKTPTVPLVSSDRALENGLGRAGLMFSPKFWKAPRLELAPYAPQEKQRGSTYVGAVGQGYGHRLVWAYGFEDEKDGGGKWETSVDAHSGEVLAIEDKNSYADASFTGGVYPVTSTEICSDPSNCGSMQANFPMPWANTGLAAPNNFTDGAGVFNYTGGTVTTTLAGKYVKISDACGAVSATSTVGDIAFGGSNGQHDCTTGGGSAGNTPASRSAFYEVNKLAAQARGWLPTNTWLQGQLTTNVNINSTCNAFWNGSTINFYRSGGGCRNTGEIGAVFDHEWGHGMDDFDANGSLSNSAEAYADIAANYRLQTSCVGHGFFWTSDRSCGQTPDGTGFNQNESQVTGSPHCNTNCSGVRDSDWAKHSDNTPDTPQNFVCTRCSTGPGPCGRQVHCSGAPVRQAAWDLVTRDLTAAPFNYSSDTAFLIGNKLFYQGSGNVGTWHSCDCTANTADGCGSTNGYMQWLAADDDNGNLNDGTPHISAIYAAFARHNIACTTPPRTNSGCAGGPTAGPSLSTATGDSQVNLTWTGVSGAQNYWVMKTEGHNGCNFGKTLTATVAGTSYTDVEVLNGRQYCYNVVGVGASNACFGAASNCSCVTPVGVCTTPTVPVLSSPSDGATGVDGTNAVLSWNAQGGATYDVQVATDAAFANVVRSTNTGSNTWTVTPALSSTTTYYWRVRAVKTCGTTAYSTGASFTTAAVCNPAVASFDAATKAPLCAANGCGCDTGAVIINSRGTMATAEQNQPNTVDSCADGASGTYHTDESLDRLKIETTDATPLDAGKTVKISATAWCFGTTDALDIYYSTNATTPTWTPVATNLLCPSGGGAHTFVQTFTLPSSTGRHVLRAQFRYGGTAGTCTTGGYNDRDDLVFQVGSGGGCTTPAAPALATPAAGATGIAVGAVLDWGDVTGATAYDVQVATDSAFTNVVRSGTALAASTWTVTPALANNTTYHWRARASNSCGAGAYSAGRSFTTVAGSTCAVTAAAFNATLKAPGCAAASCGCDTGPTLINGRGTMTNGNEINRPNALGGTCADGTSGSYHVDESLDRMVVKSVSGGNLAVGQQATVDVTVWCYSTTADFLDLYYTTNANAATPTWTAIGTGITCPGTGARTISRTFTLGSATGNHAVRAQFRYNSTAGTCSTGSYNDRDDLYFSVSAAANPSVELQDSMDGPGDRTASRDD